MNRDEVKQVFKFISEVYPQFEVTPDRLNTWTHLLKDQDPAKVMKNAKRYALENKFPPSVADIREPVLEAYSNDFIAKQNEWREKASGGKPRS